MGMIASYMMINEPTLKKWSKLDIEDVLDELYDLEEENTTEVVDIDKSWDGLHFILTGKSATEPIEGNALSEAIVGTQLFDGEASELIAYTPSKRLAEIIKSLEGVDMSKLKQEFNPTALHECDIYPSIWNRGEDKDELFDYLSNGLETLTSFYKEALSKNMNVVVSIL